jgi:hypothetical protein
MLCALPACADSAAPGNDPSPKPFKLTFGDYFYDASGEHYSGQDLNLRYRRDDTSVWIGTYRDRIFGDQTRGGVDTSWQPFVAIELAIQPSLQYATRGFVGGSLNIQYGKPWYVLAGIGRTDLHPYQNLNFDPNDALTFGVGHVTDGGNTYSLTTIKDDRLRTGQRHTHASAQIVLPRGQRVTFDLLRKTGLGDGGPVNVWGESVTYEFRAWFVRAVHDPKQNFGVADATRLSVGIRF